MTITAEELAALVGGTIEGDPLARVSKPGTIETGQKGEICFLGNDRYEEFAYTTEASILLVANTFVAKKPIAATLLRVENVYTTLAALLEKFGNTTTNAPATLSKLASIHPSVQMGKNVSVGDFTIIEEGAVIGDNCRLSGQVFVGKNTVIGSESIIYAGIKIYHDVKIGAKCIVHANVVIGSDGFGFAPQEDGSYKKIHHAGNVLIEDDVEIGANTTIDRATIGSTIIRRGVKLDNLIQVAHNVEIGENTVIAAQTAIAGSTKIGKQCRIGGQVGFSGHIKIGDNVQIQAQSGIAGNQPDGAKLFGSPAFNYGDYIRSHTIFKKLPDMWKRLNELEKRILGENT
jgi:UDP-3-O-[3-hydroxymyristoyl] glucosamine N-acyltransferase